MLNLAQLEIELYQRRYEDRILQWQSWLAYKCVPFPDDSSGNGYAKDIVIVLTVKYKHMRFNAT